MTGFGSRNFGQSNFGYGLSVRTVDEVTTQSSMDAAGYLIFNTGSINPKATTNVDIASGLLQGVFVLISAKNTTIMSGIKMQWHPHVANTTVTTNVDVTAKLAWDGQTVPDTTTWTNQLVGD